MTDVVLFLFSFLIVKDKGVFFSVEKNKLFIPGDKLNGAQGSTEILEANKINQSLSAFMRLTAIMTKITA